MAIIRISLICYISGGENCTHGSYNIWYRLVKHVVNVFRIALPSYCSRIDAKVSRRCLIDVDDCVFANCAVLTRNAPFYNRNVRTWAHFCYKTMQCAMWDWCIMGVAQQVCCNEVLSQITDNSTISSTACSGKETKQKSPNSTIQYTGGFRT